MDRKENKSTVIYKCITANTNVIWQQVACTNYHLLAAQQEPYIQQQKTINEKCLTFFWKKVQRMDH